MKVPDLYSNEYIMKHRFNNQTHDNPNLVAKMDIKQVCTKKILLGSRI
jgi:hypothetical protein